MILLQVIYETPSLILPLGKGEEKAGFGLTSSK